MKIKRKVDSKENSVNRYGKRILIALMSFSLVIGLSGGVSAAVGISTCDELQAMRDDLSGDYRLVDDIDCSATANWPGGAGFEPIGDDNDQFTGSFDGRRHIITGLHINRPNTSYVGLFGYTGSGSEIKDVGLEDVDVSGFGWVGGLVGVNGGIISSSYSTGSASCDFYGVGGLAGSNEGLITDSYSAVSVNGFSSVGGLVGYNDGDIIHSYSTGAVSGTDSGAGGLIGENENNWRVRSSFWDTETSGQSTSGGASGGGSGRTTAQMKTKSTFTSLPYGWDFCPDGDDKIWAINDGQTYPCLNWQQPGCTCFPCGDGNLDPGEECDDGNNRDGDRCSSTCRRETSRIPWERTLILVVIVIATGAIVGAAIFSFERIRRARRDDDIHTDDY